MPEGREEKAFPTFSVGAASFARNGPDIARGWALGLGAGLLPENSAGTSVVTKNRAEDLVPEQAGCPTGCRRYIVAVGETLFSIATRLGVAVDDIIACNPNLPDPTRIFPGQVICVPRRAAVTCPEGFRRYIVRTGESLYTIATRFGTSVAALLRANPQITDPDLIFPGTAICIPIRRPVRPCPARCTPYVVGPGETLFSIARRLGVSLNDVLACNPDITDPNLIFAGQTICVPARPLARCPAGFRRYTVVAGDTLYTIARRFGTSVAELLRVNPFITDPNLIFPGQVICVPAAVPGPCPRGCSPLVVRPGETIFSIARRLGVSVNDILACNPGLDPTRIFPGQTICTPSGAAVRCPRGFQRYVIVAGDTLHAIARRFRTTVAELLRVNPFITDPSLIYPGQVICVPATSPLVCPLECIPYTVRAGDTIYGIARSMGVSVADVLACNPGLPDSGVIYSGQTICVPAVAGMILSEHGTEETEDASQEVSAAPTPQQACPDGFTPYTVVAGDTLFFLARRYGTTIETLLRANPTLTDPNNLMVGQTLCVPITVPTPGPGVPSCPAGFRTHTVVAGETMFMIARRYGISLSDLMAANPQVTDPNRLMIGQVICVPNQPVCPPGSTTYVVRAGDTMYGIARRFGIGVDSLIRANPHILDPNRIAPGESMCVPSARMSAAGVSEENATTLEFTMPDGSEPGEGDALDAI